jgi:hypothetical protein
MGLLVSWGGSRGSLGPPHSRNCQIKVYAHEFGTGRMVRLRKSGLLRWQLADVLLPLFDEVLDE